MRSETLFFASVFIRVVCALLVARRVRKKTLLSCDPLAASDTASARARLTPACGTHHHAHARSRARVTARHAPA